MCLDVIYSFTTSTHMQTMKCQRKNRIGVPPTIHRSLHQRVRCMASSTQGPSVVILPHHLNLWWCSTLFYFANSKPISDKHNTSLSNLWQLPNTTETLRLVSHWPKKINEWDMPVEMKPVFECKIQQVWSFHTLSIGIWKELPVFESAFQSVT
jgi:hypothetical protein